MARHYINRRESGLDGQKKEFKELHPSEVMRKKQHNQGIKSFFPRGRMPIAENKL